MGRRWFAKGHGGVSSAPRARPLGVVALLALLWCAAIARAEEFPEYRLKAAFLFNFAVYTDWPAEVGSTLNLCIYGADPFGRDVDGLQGKAVGTDDLTNACPPPLPPPPPAAPTTAPTSASSSSWPTARGPRIRAWRTT